MHWVCKQLCFSQAFKVQNNVIRNKNLSEDFYSFYISMVQVTYSKKKKKIICLSLFASGSGVWIQLKKENLLEKRLNLLQQSWPNYQDALVVSYLTSNFKYLFWF
jgi:hypothetical protein